MNATATKFDANFSGIKMHKSTLPWDWTKKNDAKNALNFNVWEKFGSAAISNNKLWVLHH